jgi:anti-anti-sigma factor
MLTQSIGRYTPRIFSDGETPMRGSDLQVQLTPTPEALIVALVGEAHFDFDAAEAHIQKVLVLHPRQVIVDASRLSFMSSVGMCFLINLRRALHKNGATLKIAGLQPLVLTSLQKARVLGLFEVCADMAAAKASASS